MKNLLLITLIGISLVSCSTSKSTVASKVKSTTLENKKYVASSAVGEKINGIIQHRLGLPITSIARSEITKTRTGYYWKFMNVRTGEKFIGNSDLNFRSVDIRKYKKS